MSNLVDYAEMELKAIGMGADTPEEYNKMMHDHIIHMVEEFSKEGHSGFSASYALGILQKLLNFEPLTPLTGADDEWTDLSDGVGGDTDMRYQNKRCSHVFKGEDGRAYDSEGKIFRDPNGSTWQNSESRVYIEFPYTPTHEYVDRTQEEVDNDN